jgi:hypothetical protein
MLRLGCSPVGGLDRADALDDARSEAFSSINSEPGIDDFWVRLPSLTIAPLASATAAAPARTPPAERRR